MSFIEELKRRNVFRVGIAYAVATWLLIQITDIVFPRIGLPDSAVTLVIALLAIGFVPALIFAWAFEMTPDGIKKEADVDRSKSITPNTGRNLNRMIIAVLALVIFSMAAERFWFAGQDESDSQAATEIAADTTELIVQPINPDAEQVPGNSIEQESVAVLPFTAMSSGEDDGYFADGLTEEILNSLARLPELLVTARTSSFHFKGKDLPIPEIASTLGVDHIVEGSVRRSGNQVRITAQLIRAEDGFHLWSDTYDRTLEDVFAVQEDIAENIASTLDVVLNEDKRQKMRDARIEDVEAFIAYQKGMEAFGKAHATSNPGAHLAEANLWFDRALEIVPDLTNALYLRTDMYGHILYNHASGSDMRSDAELHEAQLETRTSLNKAWQSADSDTQRAMMDAERTLLSDDWSGLGAKLDEALKPGDCTPLNWLPSAGVPFGWVEQVADRERSLLRCDPLRGLPAAMLTFWETWAGEPLKAIETGEYYLQVQGFHPWLDDALFTASLASGQYRDDPDAMDPQPEGSSFLAPREFYVHALNNDLPNAKSALAAWQADYEPDDQTLMITAAILGNRELANEYAGKIDQRAGGTLLLSESIKSCFCGAPFDLDATPNYKNRIEEAGFNWPPPSAIKYPAKDW